MGRPVYPYLFGARDPAYSVLPDQNVPQLSLSRSEAISAHSPHDRHHLHHRPLADPRRPHSVLVHRVHNPAMHIPDPKLAAGLHSGVPFEAWLVHTSPRRVPRDSCTKLEKYCLILGPFMHTICE